MADEYVNEASGDRRCSYLFAVDVHLNRTSDPRDERVLSTRGMRCGLDVDPSSEQGYCFWHMGTPEKVYDPTLRERLQAAVHARTYLGEAFLAGGIQNARPGEPPPPPLDLSGAVLNAASLPGSYMQGTILRAVQMNDADLRGAWLGETDLREADLRGARLQGTDLRGASLAGADIWEVEFDHTTALTGADWGQPPTIKREKTGEYKRAESSYRALKQHYQNAGEYRMAGEFYFREMESIRRQQRAITRILWAIFFKSTMGYGERPVWTVAWMAAVILFWGLVVFPLAGIINTSGHATPSEWPPKTWEALVNSMSLSLITFATLGYGNRYPGTSWGELLAGVEAIVGVLLTSLFLVSFGKKVLRS